MSEHNLHILSYSLFSVRVVSCILSLVSLAGPYDFIRFFTY